ncbi:hypothetical protein H8959_000792 [Pygathrix nigripes]
MSSSVTSPVTELQCDLGQVAPRTLVCPAGKENNMLQPETHIFTASEEGSSQGALLLGQAPESLSLPCTPVTLEQQLVSPSGDPHRAPALPSICSTLVLQPCATLDPLLLQPQVPKISDQALVSAHSEWQRKLEAAEALLTLRNSAQVPPDSISLHQPCNPPASIQCPDVKKEGSSGPESGRDLPSLICMQHIKWKNRPS